MQHKASSTHEYFYKRGFSQLFLSFAFLFLLLLLFFQPHVKQIFGSLQHLENIFQGEDPQKILLYCLHVYRKPGISGWSLFVSYPCVWYLLMQPCLLKCTHSKYSASFDISICRDDSPSFAMSQVRGRSLRRHQCGLQRQHPMRTGKAGMERY